MRRMIAAILFAAVLSLSALPVAHADGPTGYVSCPTIYGPAVIEPVYDNEFWPLPSDWNGQQCLPATVPPQTAAPVVHTWNTSSFTGPQSVYYYCDDDPAFQQNVAPKDQASFPTVAAVLAAYPGRTLHQACKDGTTGP